MGLCKNCRWWSPNETGAVNAEQGDCNITYRHGLDAAHEQSKATAYGERGGLCADDAVLVTSPDFGCNQFEAKSG